MDTDYSTWIGRMEQVHDPLSWVQAQAAQATLDEIRSDLVSRPARIEISEPGPLRFIELRIVEVTAAEIVGTAPRRRAAAGRR